MPRPLNWIRGEGTTKNQRGLGDTLTVSGNPLGDWVDPNGVVSLTPCESITTSPGFVGPINCDPTNGMPNYVPAIGSSTTIPSDLGNCVLAVATIEPPTPKLANKPRLDIFITTLVPSDRYKSQPQSEPTLHQTSDSVHV
jgi:hypothetical protein